MTAKKKTQEADSGALDLSILTEFQFGPAWARQDGKKEYTEKGAAPQRDYSRGGERRDRKFSHGDRDRRNNGFGGERRERGDRDRFSNSSRPNGNRSGRFDRDRDRERERAPLPEPAAGLRVELRPVDIGLAVCSAEVGKHKRVVSLYDFAKVIMAKRDRYDLVFMKQEGGPQMMSSKKGDHACWLTKSEALKYIWKAGWFEEFYESLSEDAEPPKGEFQAIGKCSMTGELIGPVNWHGYQSALVNLHRSKFANMDFDRFKSKIQIEKGEEIVKEWLDSVSKKTVWRSKREGAETVLPDMTAVEKDFDEHHFGDVYETTDKVFINGSVSRNSVSPGIWAHIAKLSDITRKHPSMLIPNLCHGLARHHMPIFKWKGGHHTGPSRPRTLTPETVLADRMMQILNWATENNGKRVDAMLKALCSVPATETEAPVQTAETTETESPEAVAPAEVSGADLERQSLVKDLLWLCDQGYVLVFVDGKIAVPKNPEAPKTDKPKQKKASSKKQKPSVEGTAEEETPVSEDQSPEKETTESKPAKKPAAKKKTAAKKKPVAKPAKEQEAVVEAEKPEETTPSAESPSEE